MKNKENSIVFYTDVKCSACKRGRIFEKFTLHVVASYHNDIIGPASSSWQDTRIGVQYFCEDCGLHFEPTIKNNLEKDTKRNNEIASEKLKNAESYLLQRDLKENEAFWLGKTGTVDAILKSDNMFLNFFKKGSPVHVYVSKDSHSDAVDFQMGFSSLPYIVRTKTGTEIVMWSEKYSTQRPLFKKEKKTITSAYNKYQKEQEKHPGRGKNHLLERQFAQTELTRKIVIKDSKPLPKDSVRAIKIFSSLLLGDFYIPIDSI